LHRIENIYADDISDCLNRATNRLWSEVDEKLASVEGDLIDGREWEFHQQISPGLQEAIEAYTFQRFLGTKRVATLDETRQRFERHLITESDYILGLMDMTGEMMRYAISHLVDVSSGGISQIASEICALMRHVIGSIKLLQARNSMTGPSWRELPKKLEVANASLSKVETAMLSRIIRVAETAAVNPSA
jgi:predicted translin family RNA/ssDNA-binding protein